VKHGNNRNSGFMDVKKFLGEIGHKYSLQELKVFRSKWSDVYIKQTDDYIKQRLNYELMKIWTEE
jgi:hypothetical protein